MRWPLTRGSKYSHMIWKTLDIFGKPVANERWLFTRVGHNQRLNLMCLILNNLVSKAHSWNNSWQSCWPAYSFQWRTQLFLPSSRLWHSVFHLFCLILFLSSFLDTNKSNFNRRLGYNRQARIDYTYKSTITHRNHENTKRLICISLLTVNFALFSSSWCVMITCCSPMCLLDGQVLFMTRECFAILCCGTQVPTNSLVILTYEVMGDIHY